MDIAALTEDYRRALAGKNYTRIREIVAFLNNARNVDKKAAVALYQEIGEDSFSVSRSVPGYDLVFFRHAIRENEEDMAITASYPSTASRPVETGQTSDKEQVGGTLLNLKQVLVEFYNRHFPTFDHLKDYYLLKLQKGELVRSVSVCIATCDNSTRIPAINEFTRKEVQLNTHQKRISELEDFLKGGPQADHGVILLLLVAPNLNGLGEELIAMLKTTLGLVDEASLVMIAGHGAALTEKDIREIEDEDEIITFITENSAKIFNNKALDFEKQKLIKKFIQGNNMLIDYKILNPGASGSSVIEVQGFPVHSSHNKRYVIKIAPIKAGARRKLKDEMKRFEEHVEPGLRYGAKYDDTPLYEGIRYDYASGDSLKDAQPFAKIVERYLDHRNQDPVDLVKVIKGLTGCALFRHWDNHPQVKSQKAGQHFEKYLTGEEKILDAITDINPGFDVPGLLEAYTTIKDTELRTNSKVCHGDLHSDNFFWDGDNVTLIDFGHTGILPSVADHVFLEASIRLKHFPRHIPIEELLGYDRQFLSETSFRQDFNLNFIKRDKLRELYRAMYEIRLHAMSMLNDKTDPKEYFIALFLITFRQLQFYDLYQLYGIQLVRLMAEELFANL